MGKILTTRDVKLPESPRQRPLKTVTTREINVNPPLPEGVDTEIIQPAREEPVTIHNMEQVQAKTKSAARAKKTAEILAQREAAKKEAQAEAPSIEPDDGFEEKIRLSSIITDIDDLLQVFPRSELK